MEKTGLSLLQLVGDLHFLSSVEDSLGLLGPSGEAKVWLRKRDGLGR